MRPLAIIPILAALAAAARDARAEDGPASARAATQQEPASPPPSAPPPGDAEIYVTGDDADFEPERPRHSLALGPVGRGDMIASLDVGWLRSAVRADLGLGSWLDLVLRFDTLLLYEGFGGQNGIHVGVRASPAATGLLRAGVELTLGQLFVPGDVSMANLTALRGSATAGLVLDWATFYARGDIRWLSSLEPSGAGWARDHELGAGIERGLGRFILGAEAYLWSRPGLSTLGQWRLRVGYAI
ncbi:hypothetical protein [Anaeromyxobacter sp. Fw109-5]|uniref:hypothetical protein n=1 Tax=Anaeromyxobacter sp. (strain Fw109-5) TaxID=404589 RepID=UPI0000ED6D93|nr:hypothetical protein [Anaeromyxobacter sp. Fw109-5]ABS28559.1 conserved hypothetical protein [Anaeromyxobacter sp. Fw109-5]